MKELLVLLEDQLHARGINLHILTGICAGIHCPNGATIADKMLFMVAAMAAEFPVISTLREGAVLPQWELVA